MILMKRKTISLSDEAYRRLASMKRDGESFTDVILRLCSNTTKPLAGFAGSWVMSDEEERKIFGGTSKLWRKYGESLLKRGFSGGVTEKSI